MRTRTWLARRLRIGTAACCGVSLALTVHLAGARAQDAGPATPEAPPAAAAPVAQTLGLAECVQLALQNQPAIAVQRASLAAAADNARALGNLQVPTCLEPDLPVRRQQAHLGVTAAGAGVQRAELQTVYAVTRTYITVIYAREQEQVARHVVDRLKALSETAQTQLKFGAKGVTQDDIDRIAVYADLAEAKRQQAAEGVTRALAALREAVGLGPGCALDVPDGRLPEPDVRPCLGDAIAGALGRRADLVQADIFSQVTGLEVDAQATSHRSRKETFASATDIHARQVRAGVQTATEYAPGAEPPEMPTMLVGSRDDRVQRASDFHARAEASVEKTRNLIVLQVEDAYRRWEGAAARVVPARRAADTGDRLAANLRKAYTTTGGVATADVINAEVVASQARSQYNQFLYEEFIALADLERVTGGAFCAGLAGAIQAGQTAPAPAGEQKEEKTPAPEGKKKETPLFGP